MNRGPDPEPGGDARLFALLSLARRRLAAGEHAQAIIAMQDAARVAPAHAPVHHDLGFLCLQAGRLPEAVAALQTALRLDPGFAQASLCLGIALQDQGDTVGAEAAYRRALALQPALVVAAVCLGALLESRGDITQAVQVFRDGAAKAPDTLWGRLAGARALIAADRDLEAEAGLRELVRLHPTNGMAQEMLATVLANSGRFDEARAAYERTIAVAPTLAGCYYDLVRCRRVTAGDGPLVDRMQAALESPSLTPDARLKVHLALGKARDDLGDPETAMRHFAQADTTRRGMTHFDAAAFERRIERLIAWFTPERLARAAAATRPAAATHPADATHPAAATRPAAATHPADATHAAAATHAPHGDTGGGASAIFVMGLPRSGTTLVEQILSGHPQVHAAGELGFWTHRSAAWEAASSVDTSAWGAEYLALLRTLAPQARRITDKAPLNVLWAGLIHRALPDATLIYCRRAAVDVALSIHRTYFNPQVSFPTGGRDLVTAIHAVERLADHWRAVLPPDRFIDVRYEELVREPGPVIRRLTAHCKLPWNDACLRPERNPRVIKTPSKWQARQPIHRDALESWRRYAPWLAELAVLVA